MSNIGPSWPSCLSNTNEPLSLLQVYLRIRPMNEDEILIGATHIAHKVEDRVSIYLYALSVNMSRVDRKTVASQVVVFPNT